MNKQLKRATRIQQAQSDALVEILDAARHYKHDIDYEEHRLLMQHQLQEIKENRMILTHKSKFILIDNIRINPQVKYKTVIMVFSHSKNFNMRARIRKMWGNPVMWKTTEKFALVFSLGGISDKGIFEKIYEESKKHRDILLESIPEHNFSSKLVISFDWLIKSKLDYDFVLKCEDDVFVNIDNVMKILNTEKYAKAHFFGNAKIDDHPIRQGRFKISNIDYTKKVYLDYISGTCVFVSKVLLQRIAPYFNFINPMKLQDVYLGMLVADYGEGVKAMHLKGLHLNHNSCSYSSTALFIHPVRTFECMRLLTQAARSKQRII